jgi:hypothetical protein
MYVRPEYPTASGFPNPFGWISIQACTDWISLCCSATTQSWSGRLTRYSTCIIMGDCLLVAVIPIRRTLCRFDLKNMLLVGPKEKPVTPWIE